ncbi:MAG TPA: putative sulfate exporter family transporter [Methanomassiliicoccales archaeon]|nr:putative sulfate exporter family transporter [Methanomassiliicoccales archaeon]
MSYVDDAKLYLRVGRKEVPGLLFCLIVAVASYLVTRGTLFEGGPRLLDSNLFADNPLASFLFKVGPIVLALLIGLLVNVSPIYPGGAYAGRFLLRLAIVLMGARVTLDVLSKASPVGIVIILAVMAFTVWFSLFLGRKVRLEKDASALIGTGNSVCGVSACLSVAPVIDAKAHNTHAVIGVISVLGLIGVFVVPWLASIAGLDAAQAEVLIGGSLHEVGNVIPAADLYHNALGGEDVAALVLAYKMIRVAMLVVVAYVLARLFRGEGRTSGTRMPGFLIAFVIVAALMSLLIMVLPEMGGEVRSIVVSSSASLLTVAMAGVGLSMNLRQTVKIGRKLMPVAALVWVVQLGLLFALTFLLV